MNVETVIRRFQEEPAAVDEWNRSREDGGGDPIPDLDGANFADAELSRLNLSGLSLREADFSLANLSRANLERAVVNAANLTESKLIEANLAHADLRFAILRRAHLARASLAHADCRHADLARADLTGADLTGVNLEGADLSHANLTDVNLTDANLAGAVLADVRLNFAILRGTDLSGVRLDGAELTGTDLRSLDLRGVDLDRVRVGPSFQGIGLDWETARGLAANPYLNGICYLLLLFVPFLVVSRSPIAIAAEEEGVASVSSPDSIRSNGAIAFFGALCVVLGHVVYVARAPMALQEGSAERSVKEAMARFREPGTDRREALAGALESLEALARAAPRRHHPNLVRHRGKLTWIPSRVESWDRPDLPSRDPATGDASTGLTPQEVAIEAGARARFEIETLGHPLASRLVVVSYVAGFSLLAQAIGRQAVTLGKVAGWW